ncbi:MAG: hypothetical protein ACLFTT_16685 [Candidatus Hydrogenedentota bacterium]
MVGTLLHAGGLLLLCSMAMLACGESDQASASAQPDAAEDARLHEVRTQLNHMLALLEEKEYKTFFEDYVSPTVVTRLSEGGEDYVHCFARSGLPDALEDSLEFALRADPVFTEDGSFVRFQANDDPNHLVLQKFSGHWRILD